MKRDILLMVVVVFALACGQPNHFIPGKSPTVTPRYDPDGTPTAPIVVSPDLPEGWRWQYSRDFPSKGDDNWLLLDEESVIAGFIFNTRADCWFLIGGGAPEPPCIDKDEVGKQAVEVLVARHENRSEPTAAVEPTATVNQEHRWKRSRLHLIQRKPAGNTRYSSRPMETSPGRPRCSEAASIK